jgi:hypothetical protein
MENSIFENLSAVQICNRMAAICQRSADETSAGLEQERFQAASDKFRNEADMLALADLQQSSHWHINCSTAKTGSNSMSSLDRRMKKGGLRIVKGALRTRNPY